MGGAGSEVSRDPIFSWAVLAEVGLAMEGLGPRPGPGWLLPCSVAATSRSGVSRAQAAGAGALRVESRQVPLLRALPPPNAAPPSWRSCPGARDLDQAGSSSACAPSPECSPSVLAEPLRSKRPRSGACCRLPTLFSACFLPFLPRAGRRVHLLFPSRVSASRARL